MADGSDARLDYEKLDVYTCAIEFLAIALGIATRLPHGEKDLRSQLKRAAMSIPLNIAEGCGKPTGPDRARFNAIARGSAMECGSIIHVCAVAGHIKPEDAQSARQLVVRLVAMLSRMCRTAT